MNKNALKENIMIILTIIVVIIAIIGINNNKKQPLYQNEVISSEATPSFDNPDRIVYKAGKEDKYYVFTKEDKEQYNNILTELVKGITGLSDGEILTEEEVRGFEENENCVILDYNKKSKNYMIRLNSNDASVLKQQENDWKVVKRLIVNKLDIQKTIDKAIKDRQSYTMKTNKNYLSQNTIEQIPMEYKEKMKKEGISSYMIINDIDTLHKFNQDFNVAIGLEFSQEIFNNNNIIALVTKGKINEIKTSIGHIKYDISYEEYNGYMINLYVVSKAVNSNCIYITTKENDIIKSKNGYIVKDNIEYTLVISNNLLVSSEIKELGLKDEGNKTYSKILTREELINIINKKEIKPISDMSYYNNLTEKYGEDTKYIILLKNTKGRLSLKDFEYIDKYEGIPIEKNINLDIFDIASTVGKTTLKGIIIQLPQGVEIENTKLNRSQISRNKIINKNIKIKEEQVLEIAKKHMNQNDGKYDIYTDIVVNTSDIFIQHKFDLEKVDSLVQAYIVCKVQSENFSQMQQVIINAQTGEVIGDDELPC